MRLIDVDASTEPTFLRCLHDEAPDDQRVIALRRRWYEAHRKLGLRSKVLRLDGGEVVALCQYMPIEHTHLVGKDLLAILCIWVHGYEHHVGNRQGNGYGRFILESIEADARASGASGVAAWGMDFPYWNPVSFYEHMGYRRVDKSGMAVLVWKPFVETATPPAFHSERRRPSPGSKKVSVTLLLNAWCSGACGQCVAAREAVAGLEDIVDYVEVDTSNPETLREWGTSNELFLEGDPYRQDEPPWTSEMLRVDILDLAARKMAGRE
jgi:GNAT superfamily N-acetyltransferase